MKDADTRPTLKPTSPEAKRFVDLAKKVFSVPKEEIDQKHAEYEKRKPHKHRTNGKSR